MMAAIAVASYAFTPGPIGAQSPTPIQGDLIDAPAPSGNDTPTTSTARGVDFSTIDQSFPGARMAATPVATKTLDESDKIEKVTWKGKEYDLLTFGLLAGYEYRTPAPEAMPKDATAMPTGFENQIPPAIKELQGRNVAVQGFMIPLELEKGRVKSLVLVRNQMFCCFGSVPMMNEWLHIKMEGDARAPYISDVPLVFYGKFDVGEVFEKGTLMSIYRLDATSVEVKSAD